MRNLFRIFPIFVIFSFLIKCDLEPISAGTWSIEVVAEQGVQSSVWTITADGTISIDGDTTRVVNEVVLEGSRIYWSDNIPDPAEPGQTMNLNFSGTVDGNDLGGTIFTTLGNLTVNGVRQQGIVN